MTPRKFTKRPVTVEAMRWNGENATEIANWAQGGWKGRTEFDNRAGGMWLKQIVVDEEQMLCLWRLVIPTLEGDHEAMPGDWIIKGIAGEFYPCKPAIFEATYQPETD